jgi:hypothetical protein
MMSAIRGSLVALLVLAACDGNPFPGGPATGGGSGGGSGGNASVNTLGDNLLGTSNPGAGSGIARGEDTNKGPGKVAVTGNGYAKGYVYDKTADTFTVDNLAFDGGNVYTRDVKMPTVGPANVYAGAGVYPDTVTGALIDQFSYRALYGVSTSGHTQFAIVRTGAYASYGFGGFVFSRDNGVTLPTSGQAQYLGTYAGLRDTNGAGGLQYTSGDMKMDIDFKDFEAKTSPTGNGAGIKGYVYNRQIFDLAGNDITSSVIASINADKKPDAPLTALPTLVFDVGPGALDNNGEAQFGLGSKLTIKGTATPFESGKYYAVVSGNNADEVAGVLVVTSTVNSVETRETGGFILYRPGP